jgi:hypothetical protein
MVVPRTFDSWRCRVLPKVEGGTAEIAKESALAQPPFGGHFGQYPEKGTVPAGQLLSLMVEVRAVVTEATDVAISVWVDAQ